MASLKLTDLMSPEMLQEFQDAFSDMTGLAALTTDADGVPVTRGSNFTSYCMDKIRKNKKGCERCENCDRSGAIKTLKTGKPTTYYCHSGLVDFAAPIMVNGEMIGSFIGGQVLPETPSRDKIYKVADELGIGEDELWEAAQDVYILPMEEIDKRADYLFKIANILSQMAFSNYMTVKASAEIERAANMKSDFLANMSHEIRTPMNAVIGLAEMALREQLPPAARDYIGQIKSSGRALLSIINDILDFSKIESGKMDIIPVEFEPLSIINDVANIISVKLGEKEIELLLDINPNFPRLLEGDNIRIKQVLINIANNAVKFTNEGFVKIMLDYEQIDDNTIDFECAIMDTGIGIKSEDKSKLFRSFYQLDSKRNRNIEGTGLGLAISKRLLDLMNGKISFLSEYGKGTTFYISIPLKVLDPDPSVKIAGSEKTFIICVVYDDNLRDQVRKDVKALGMAYRSMKTFADVDEFLKSPERNEYERICIITEKNCLNATLDQILIRYTEVECICFDNFMGDTKSSFPNLKIGKKPFSVVKLAMLMKGDEYIFSGDNHESYEIDFKAPDAKILIVDDNPVNLTVAEGLLEPLEMNINTAVSGKQALKLIADRKYDLIFMDHMMPELDGIDTTRIIRRLHPQYDDVPIIALTANAVEGARNMFLNEGMQDFVAKPIDVRVLISKVKKWLKPSLMIKRTPSEMSSHDAASSALSAADSVFDSVIEDIDFPSAKQMIGSDKLFEKIVREYFKTIPEIHSSIKSAYEEKDYKNYTILVHALKSSSRQIGAVALADMAAELEAAGKDMNVGMIDEKTPYLLQKYLYYRTLLAPYLEMGMHGDEVAESIAPAKKEIYQKEIVSILDKLFCAADELDMDKMEEYGSELTKYAFEGDQAKFLEDMNEAIDHVDVEKCQELCMNWKALYT